MDSDNPDPDAVEDGGVGQRVAEYCETTGFWPLLLLAQFLRDEPVKRTAQTTISLAKGFAVGTAVWVVLVGWFIGRTSAQTVGESGCDTLLQQVAENGVPLVMQWGVVIMAIVAIVQLIQYGRHSNPKKADQAMDNVKQAAGVAVAIVLVPTGIKMILGDMFGVSLAECMDVGIGIL